MDILPKQRPLFNNVTFGAIDFNNGPRDIYNESVSDDSGEEEATEEHVDNSAARNQVLVNRS